MAAQRFENSTSFYVIYSGVLWHTLRSADTYGSLVGLDQIRDVLLLFPVSDFHDKDDFHHHHPKYCMLMVNHWSQIDGSCSDFDAVCLAIGIWDRLGVNLRCPCCIYQCHYCFLEWPFFFSSEVKSLHYKKRNA